MRIPVHVKLLKAIDLIALLAWLTLERAIRLSFVLAKALSLKLFTACKPLGRLQYARRLLQSPMAKETRDLLESPTMRTLRESLFDNLNWLRCFLNNSPLARRLLLTLLLLLFLRAFLWGESGPPAGIWTPYGSCVASYYEQGFIGKPTASGELFSPYEFTAAHKTLPFDTYLRLRNIDNGRETVVRINDRGPFVSGRELDLSRAAAKALGMLDSGLARVELRILKEKEAPRP